MDKKTLLGGAAALIMGAGLFAAPASAAIEWTWGGDAKLTATMKDTCVTTATTLATDDNQTIGGTRAALATFLGIDYVVDDDDGGVTDRTDDIEDGIDAIMGGTAVIDEDADVTVNITFDDTYNCASGVSMESPIWATSSKLEWSAGGTLANGLSVATDQDAAITLGGAFGEITFKEDGDSAAKASFAAGDGDLTVAGAGFGGHALGTAGTDGYVVTYAAPSVGGMNLFLSYAPNSGKAATDDADYTDTIGFGASFGMDALTISAGYESASVTAGSASVCDYTASPTIDGDATSISAIDLIDTVYGTDECGDQTLLVLGAAMDAGGLSIDAGWSELDTGEADRTTTSINASTSTGGWDLSVGYTNVVKASSLAGADTTQTAIGASVGTSLGDGVSLTLTASNNEYADDSQSTTRGGNGATNDFLAEAELKIVY